MKNKKGITLIAVIITLIVLLILLTITVRVIGGEGLFSKAEDARSDLEYAQFNTRVREDVARALQNCYEEGNRNPTIEDVVEKLQDIYGDENVIINDDGTITVKEDGMETKVDEVFGNV